MYVDEVLCHGENGGAAWETSHRVCIMRKVVGKAVTAGGRFDFSGLCPCYSYYIKDFENPLESVTPNMHADDKCVTIASETVFI